MHTAARKADNGLDGLVHGEIDGLVWYEVSTKAYGWQAAMRKQDLEGHDTMVVVATSLPGEYELGILMRSPEKIGGHQEMGAFRPFYPSEAFPGRIVVTRISDFTGERVTEWMRHNVEVPEELDLSIEFGSYSSIAVVATTMRNGRIVRVRRKLRGDIAFREALAQETPYLLRNCRRPSNGTAMTCSRHVSEILRSVTHYGAARIRSWIGECETNPRDPQELALTGFFLPGTSVTRLVLSWDAKTSVIRGSVEIEGGHSLKDDASGVEIALKTVLPDTMVSGLKGEPFSVVVDAPWADALTVRLARPSRDGRSTMRGAAEGVPFDPQTNPPHLDAGQSVALLREYDAETWPIVRAVEASAMQVLSRLEPYALLSLIEMMRAQGRVDLSIFGLEGWKTSLFGNLLKLEECPQVEYGDLFAAVSGEAPANEVDGPAGGGAEPSGRPPVGGRRQDQTTSR